MVFNPGSAVELLCDDLLLTKALRPPGKSRRLLDEDGNPVTVPHSSRRPCPANLHPLLLPLLEMPATPTELSPRLPKRSLAGSGKLQLSSSVPVLAAPSSSKTAPLSPGHIQQTQKQRTLRTRGFGPEFLFPSAEDALQEPAAMTCGFSVRGPRLLLPTANPTNDQARVQNAGAALIGMRQRFVEGALLGENNDDRVMSPPNPQEAIQSANRGMGTPRENRGILRDADRLDLAYPGVNPRAPKSPRFIRTATIPRTPLPRKLQPPKEKQTPAKKAVAEFYKPQQKSRGP
eukprot:TRINITY_DN31234_c0_g1_i1.p1 TRINITY_DN31234_c0_g1~~TRINITY_DN31234_c0_g1_i1.p1  ORF type:complete len:289 (+),score=45.12 TRINITY_DN31234_c0_g1_i1:133-999(+)